MSDAKKQTKKDLEDKIAQLESKLNKLSTQLQTPAEAKPAETKPAEAKPAETKPSERPAATTKPKGTLPKGFETKPAEAKPAETKPAEVKEQLPVTFNDALEEAYMNAPMTDFHKYRATVTGYSPAPNRYFVRKTAPVGKVPTSNWNEQKTKVPGYTAASNQYFATKARFASYPGHKFFGGFSGHLMTVEGVAAKAQTQQAPPPPPKPKKGTLPKG
ncbi:MAG: trans-sialidase, partial [Nitrosopumilus sp.]|nr:trans-sialidase [Nitrosopumilus sp.]